LRAENAGRVCEGKGGMLWTITACIIIAILACRAINAMERDKR
jgi:hypothetical protein